MIKAIASLLAMLMLAGCSGISLSIDELISPPRLSAEQTAIYSALEVAVGTKSVKFKYPRRGENLSACIFFDLDFDGVDEAIVFYELTINSVTSNWMSVLEQNEGNWRSRHQFPGENGEIDFVDFAPIENRNVNNIIVGWSQSGQENFLCKVYSYSQEGVVASYEDSYSQILIKDIDQNGLSEIVLCRKLGSRIGEVAVAKYRSGRISKTGEVELENTIADYVNIVSGKLTTGLNAIFIDVNLGDEHVATEIIAVSDTRGNIEKLSNEELGVFQGFRRLSPTLYCRDVNDDGIVDIPVTYPMPGYENALERDAISRIDYVSLVKGTLTTVESSAVNFAGGYKFILPLAWKDTVTVKKQSTTGEWSFVLFNENLENSYNELLNIRVSSPADYKDKFETAQYLTIATKGVNNYEAHIPDVNYPGYSITQQQLLERFVLLD